MLKIRIANIDLQDTPFFNPLRPIVAYLLLHVCSILQENGLQQYSQQNHKSLMLFKRYKCPIGLIESHDQPASILDLSCS